MLCYRTFMAFSLILPFAVGRATHSDTVPKVRTEGGRRLRSGWRDPKSSFALSAVHTVRFESEKIVHVRHEVSFKEPSARRLTGGLALGTQRDKIRSFMALSVAMYSSNSTACGSECRIPILAAGDSRNDPSITSLEDDMAADRAVYDAIIHDLEDAQDEFELSNANFTHDVTSSNSTGVHAMEFFRQGFGTVLVFRGTTTSADTASFLLWTTDWILTRMPAQLKYQWINVAGQEWTEEMSRREDMHFDVLSRSAFAGATAVFSRSFLNDLVGHSQAHEEMDEEEVARTAYWEFTKAIAESVRDSVSANAHTPLHLSGHSQGGMRAALVSMYYEKKYNETVEAITFSGIGTSCLARGSGEVGLGLTWHGDLTADVDPFIHHPQITDYTHVLDPLGFMDYDAGTQCILGTSDIADSGARRWCEGVIGYAPSTFFTAGALGRDDIDLSLKQCAYNVHNREAVFQMLNNDNYLFEDGTTDGGCARSGPISRDDPRSLCNTGAGLLEVDGCNDQRSCEACAMSSSADLVGFQCFWCASSGTCHSRGVTLLSSCDSGYVGGDAQCVAGALGGFNASDSAQVSGAPQQTHAAAVVFIQAALALLMVPL